MVKIKKLHYFEILNQYYSNIILKFVSTNAYIFDLFLSLSLFLSENNRNKNIKNNF